LRKKQLRFGRGQATINRRRHQLRAAGPSQRRQFAAARQEI